MKKSALLVALIALVGPLTAAETVPAVAPKDAVVQKGGNAPVQVKPASKVVDKKVVKEKEPVIPGMTLVRPNGGFLGFEVLSGQMKLSFYDKKKKPTAVDVDRGLARWPNPRGNGQLTTPLNPASNVMVGAKPVLPPYNYNITVNLLKGEGDAAKVVETYVISYR